MAIFLKDTNLRISIAIAVVVTPLAYTRHDFDNACMIFTYAGGVTLFPLLYVFPLILSESELHVVAFPIHKLSNMTEIVRSIEIYSNYHRSFRTFHLL